MLGVIARWVVIAPLEHPLLQNETRREIVQLVHDRPGISMRELSSRLGLDWSSLHYHVQRLLAAEILATTLAGRRRLVYPAALAGHEDPAERAALSEATARRIASAIAARPGTSAVELVEDLRESQRVVYHHLKKLVDLGLVTTPSPASRRGLVATPRLLALLGEIE